MTPRALPRPCCGLREKIPDMAMKNPPPWGGVIRREVIEPLRLTVTEAAKALGVGRRALSSLLNEKAGLTSDMALRVEKAFGPK